MRTEANALHLPQCVGHASLISQESGEVHRAAGIVFGPWSHPAPVLLATLPGQEAHVSMARCMELAMWLEEDKKHTYFHKSFHIESTVEVWIKASNVLII